MTRLKREGLSLRRISDETNVSIASIRQWLRDVGLDTSEKTSRGASKPSPTHQRAKDVMSRALEAAAAPIGTSEGVQAVRERLAQFRAMVSEFAPLAMSGEINPQAVSTLSNLEIRYAKELAEIEAANKPAPEDTPENETLAAETRAMLDTRIARSEAQRRCIHCGMHPDR